MPSPHAPRQIQHLPFNLLRNHLTTTNPPTFRQAVQMAIGGAIQPAGYFPISTMYMQWRRPQLQYPGSAVAGAMGASKAYPQVRQLANLDRRRVPVMTANMAGQRLNQLPQTTNVRLGPAPVAKALPPNWVPLQDLISFARRSRRVPPPPPQPGATPRLPRVTPLDPQQRYSVTYYR